MVPKHTQLILRMPKSPDYYPNSYSEGSISPPAEFDGFFSGFLVDILSFSIKIPLP